VDVLQQAGIRIEDGPRIQALGLIVAMCNCPITEDSCRPAFRIHELHTASYILHTASYRFIQFLKFMMDHT